MKSLIGKVVLSMVLAVWTLSSNPAHARKPLQINEYQKFTPVLEQVDLVKLKIDESSTRDSTRENNYNCASIAKNLCVAVGYDLDRQGEEVAKQSDFGKRLYFIEKINGNFRVKYKSRGAADAWQRYVTYYRHPTDGSVIILADDYDETAYGTAVFIAKANQILDAGRFHVMVAAKPQDQSAILPFIKIRQEGDQTIFTFTVDVDKYTDNESSYIRIPKEKIYYAYNELGFQEFIDNQPTSLHKAEKDLPDKIITSKKLRGRLIEIISGDYFYAKVSTKYGEETFLLDSNEGCFLSKHPKEQLLIYYDVLDRYTPQASGYRRVNVIRNITARKTSLKKWRMTLAKNKLGECNN
jgi:hypothetical protein